MDRQVGNGVLAIVGIVIAILIGARLALHPPGEPVIQPPPYSWPAVLSARP